MLHSRKRFESWLPALFDGEFQWDFLLPAWHGTKIQPMDFDAVVEKNGHILIFETKIKDKGIELGQQITLTDQWKKGATIFQVEGKSPEFISGLACYWEGKYDAKVKVGSKPIKKCDAYDVVFRARQWFCRANSWPVPTRERWDIELWTWDYDRTEVVSDAAR